MHVLWHDGDSLGVDGAEVGVFEERNEVGFGGFLEGEDGGGLESEVRFEFLSDFSDESLERQLSDEELGRFLVSSDLSECDCSWSISVRFLHASALGGGLSGSLLSNMFSWSFSSSVLSSGLLCSSHFKYIIIYNPKIKVFIGRGKQNICDSIGRFQIVKDEVQTLSIVEVWAVNKKI